MEKESIQHKKILNINLSQFSNYVSLREKLKNIEKMVEESLKIN
jgi:hypothetical protein